MSDLKTKAQSHIEEAVAKSLPAVIASNIVASVGAMVLMEAYEKDQKGNNKYRVVDPSDPAYFDKLVVGINYLARNKEAESKGEADMQRIFKDDFVVLQQKEPNTRATEYLTTRLLGKMPEQLKLDHNITMLSVLAKKAETERKLTEQTAIPSYFL
jgi:hypothetical protein